MLLVRSISWRNTPTILLVLSIAFFILASGSAIFETVRRNSGFLSLSKAGGLKSEHSTAGGQGVNDLQKAEAKLLAPPVRPNSPWFLLPLFQLKGEINSFPIAATSFDKERIKAEHLIHWAKKAEDSEPALDNALAWFEQAQRLDPNSFDVWHESGLFHRRHKNWPAAVKALQIAVELDPNDGSGWFELGWACLQSGDGGCAKFAFDNAFQFAETMEWIGPSIPLFYLGHLHQFVLQPRDLELSSWYYDQAIETDRFETNYWFEKELKSESFHRLGLIAESNGDSNSALVNYQTALSLHPENYGASIAFAKFLHNQGQTPQAIEILNKAIDIEPGRAEAPAALSAIEADSN